MTKLRIVVGFLLVAAAPWGARAQEPAEPRFSRHVTAVFSRAGCNGGTCHGAVQGKNGFRLSLFGAKPELDFEQVRRGALGRRIDLISPDDSLLLLKAVGGMGHGGGKILSPESAEFRVLRNWIAQGAAGDDAAASRVESLVIEPSQTVLVPGESYRLQATATFADGSSEDVTSLCSFSSSDPGVAAVDSAGQVTAMGIGDASVIVRFREEPAMSMAEVARPGKSTGPAVQPFNFVDEQILAKLKRLNIPPSELASDAEFLRRARLDVTGALPEPDEVRAFLADVDPNKRAKKIEALLADPGHAAIWTLKFCDLLKATDFGVYADGLSEAHDAPRFQAWVRARIEENTPYDEFAARVLTATSREGRSIESWADEVVALEEGYQSPRTDLELYAKRKTLDAYWQRKDSNGVSGAIQVAHAFLGLRLDCARCHRHPHDVWQQDDLLSFANFLMRVRTVGFSGEAQKKYEVEGKIFADYQEQGKKLIEEAKKLKEGEGKKITEEQRTLKSDSGRLKNEIAKHQQTADQWTSQANAKRKQSESQESEKAKLLEEAAALEQKAADELKQVQTKTAEREKLEERIVQIDDRLQEIAAMDLRGKRLSGDTAKRILYSQIHNLTGDAATKPAMVSSPLGEQSSSEFRLLGEQTPIEIGPSEDPREKLVEWLRAPENPFFAKAIVNRVWSHYFGRGIIDPPDDLSPLNPPSHPELLDQLCQGFIAAKFDLRWLHRTILSSRTYQQTSIATAENAMDRSNYAYFYFRRLPAEVALDALNQATGSSEKMDMTYYHWPEEMKTVEIPYNPRNEFVLFMLEHFGRPSRNSSVQCDCEREDDSSILQVLSLFNHPHIWEKIAAPEGRVKAALELADSQAQIEELYLGTLSRLPDEKERAACEAAIASAESPEAGLQTVLWSLLNTREFILQH